MTKPLLEVRNLRTWVQTAGAPVRAVDGVSFSIARGETYALLGESGCGKSTTALSISRLLPPAASVLSGSVQLEGRDLLLLPEADMRHIRGRHIGMIFQEPAASLNSVLPIGQQVAEVIERHTALRGASTAKRVLDLLDAVGIPDARRRIGDYPFQLSGGLKQRVMIAIALACDPSLLIADEPTSALDVTIQAQVLDLLRDLQRRLGMAMLLITHDLGVVAETAHRVGVMYAGQIVEEAASAAFFRSPQHPYSQKLFASVPGRHARRAPLAVIGGSVPRLNHEFVGCRFADRCDQAWERCRAEAPEWTPMAGGGVRCHRYAEGRIATAVDTPSAAGVDSVPASDSRGTALLEVVDLKIHFPVRAGLFRRTVGWLHAVDGVSLRIPSGHTLALVGESGCGKTTAGKGVLQLLPAQQGTVRFDGVDLASLAPSALRLRRKDFQIIFQDPYSSLNPRMRVQEIIAEGMSALNAVPASERPAEVERLLEQVGLDADMKYRYPHEFSGGQRQRIAIARALAVRPRLIVCDEPTSALDVSVQAQILNLLKELQDRLGLAYLFITHNLSVVEFLAHEVAVMYLGRIVEQGTVDEVLGDPKHPYTRALLSAVPSISRDGATAKIRLAGDLPSPLSPPAGCHFHPRCPQAMPQCRETYPNASALSGTRMVKCHLYGRMKDEG